jgi:hypothetical protein
MHVGVANRTARARCRSGLGMAVIDRPARQQSFVASECAAARTLRTAYVPDVVAQG